MPNPGITLQRYLLAVAAGAAIGGIFVRLLSSQLWALPIGMAVGGLLAWVAVDFAQFKRGISVAFRQTIATAVSKETRAAMLKLAIVCASFAVFVGIDLYILCTFGVKAADRSSLVEFVVLVTAILLVYGILFGVVAIPFALIGGWRIERSKISFIRAYLMLAALTNPVGFSLALVAVVGWVVWRTPTIAHKVWSGVRVLVKFTALAYLYVNSERRTGAFVHTALGIGAGYVIDPGPASVLAGLVVGLCFAYAGWHVAQRHDAQLIQR